MEMLYRGFDGLDVSFSWQIGPDFCGALEDAKQNAQDKRRPWPLVWNGIPLLVLESGARGGYAFMASTGPYGATWFFKKPNSRDPWGVRVSCNSFGLATKGLGGARAELYETLEHLCTPVALGEESIGRVDYAIDLYAPQFVLEPQCFVMHSNARRSDHYEPPEMTANGTSGRVTSVTVGKMPGRQVIVYDKRSEVIDKRKVGWWVIWDAARANQGLPPLNRELAAQSLVWRVELRAGKHHLKASGIRTWAQLDAYFGDMIAATLKATRHTQPSIDSNRSRWPNSVLWERVEAEASADLFEMRNWADPDLVKRVQREAYDQMLACQMTGLLTTRAALSDKEFGELPSFATYIGQQMADQIARAGPQFERKLRLAKSRFLFVSGNKSCEPAERRST